MNKKLQPKIKKLWQDPNFVYKQSVHTNVLETLKRFGFIPPSEIKKDHQ
jgi:hypothetical protein